MDLFRYIKDLFTGKTIYGAKRSSRWLQIRKEYIKNNPYCRCCGGKDKLEVHHKKPFWLFPKLELEFSNLITLCEKKLCHFTIGHLYSWKSYNPNIDKDIEIWNRKVAERP